jgi:SagB-type dehydrogenase family enzyme
MNTKTTKSSLLLSLILLSLAGWSQVPGMKAIKLNAPNLKRGLPVMEALSVRASVKEWSDRELSLQDLSDLLWAADGVNRPESGKRTAASAINAQDVDVYAFLKDGAYLYDAKAHSLIPVAAGDYRTEIAIRPGGPGGPGAGPQNPPGVLLLMVSDSSRFRMGSPELKSEWGAIDTGIVSQNISLFCAATGLGTRPRASINQEKAKSVLKLKETQHPFLNHPVGYLK